LPERERIAAVRAKFRGDVPVRGMLFQSKDDALGWLDSN
jgi:hypothetical protein